MKNMEASWTHRQVKLKDVRKSYKLYTLLLDVQDEYGVDIITTVSHKIFEEIIQSYFMKSFNYITREQILNLNFNLYLTKGYYIKIDKYTHEEIRINKENHPNKYFISYIDVNTPLVDNIFYNINTVSDNPEENING